MIKENNIITVYDEENNGKDYHILLTTTLDDKDYVMFFDNTSEEEEQEIFVAQYENDELDFEIEEDKRQKLDEILSEYIQKMEDPNEEMVNE